MSSDQDPIPSFGIILFHVDTDNVIWFLVAQRRDTIEYADFLRGRYARNHLEPYFKLMTIEERSRLQQYSFDQLWDDLWVNHDNKYYRDVKPKAKQKYESNQDVMDALLHGTRSVVTSPSWGFPKGKKNVAETELQCAVREFKEETKMSIDYINILNMSPVEEVFKGSNSKMYSTLYYIAQIDHKLPIRKMTLFGIRKETVSEEISNLSWTTAKNAIFLPPWRQKILFDLEKKIIEYLSTHDTASNSHIIDWKNLQK